MESIRIETLSEFKAAGYRVSCQCNNPYCRRHNFLELDKLIKDLGPDYRIAGNESFRRRLFCRRCGSKNLGVTVHPVTTIRGRGYD